MTNLAETSPEHARDLMRDGTLRPVVVGLGYAGLDLAVTLLMAGANVIGFDIDTRKVNMVRKGECPINIPFLKKRFEELSTKRRMMNVASNIGEALAKSDVIFIVVPTPLTADRRPDLSMLRSATRDVGRFLRKGQLVIVESTVHPKTIRKLVLPTLETESGLRAEVDFLLAYCPERIDPGNETHRLDNTPRVLGGIGPISSNVAAAIYASFIDAPIQRVSSCEVAELAKLLENVYRDVNIALVNEIAVLSERLGIDFLEVVQAASTKWSFQPHFPGAGVGGNCIPVIPYYILESAKEHNVELKIVQTAREVNETMPAHVVKLVGDALGELGREIIGSKVAILGIAYKAGVDDVRWSPAEEILNSLTNSGAIVSCYDPLVSNAPESFSKALRRSLTETLREANCVVVATDHDEFRALSPSKILELAGVSELAVIDGRNIFSPQDFTRKGIVFKGVGRSANALINLREIQPDDRNT